MNVRRTSNAFRFLKYTHYAISDVDVTIAMERFRFDLSCLPQARVQSASVVYVGMHEKHSQKD